MRWGWASVEGSGEKEFGVEVYLDWEWLWDP